MMAPRVATTTLQMKPPAPKPSSPTTQPPMMPPTMPSKMSAIVPYPPPFMILPAAHPAMRPTMTHQMIPCAMRSSWNQSTEQKMVRYRFGAGFALRNCQTLQMRDSGGPVSKLVGGSQAPNHLLMLWELANQVRALCYFKVGKVEAWGHSAPHKRPRLPIGHVRGEPA